MDLMLDGIVFPSAVLMYNIVTTTLYFVRSGYANISMGYLRHTGYAGYNLSTSASSKHYNSIKPSTYNLDFNMPDAYSSGGPTDRFFGFPLRAKKY